VAFQMCPGGPGLRRIGNDNIGTTPQERLRRCR
jgi:hypothetical protein